MSARRRFFYTLITLLLTLGPAAQAKADCAGADMSDGQLCLFESGMGIVGDPGTSDQYVLVASNMYPFQEQPTGTDLHEAYLAATSNYDAGYDFRQSLLLIGATVDGTTALGRMLMDPKLNYETAGLLDDLEETETKLIGARNTFAYDSYIDYQPLDGSSPRANLLETLKLMANIYLMIGDEFLIDALEFRFSANTLGAEQKLTEQIGLLEKAGTYYLKTIDTFTYGFSPAVDTDIYMADYYDESVFSLFHLATERMSMALREKSAKQLAKLISPDPLVEAQARNVAGATLKDTYVSTYLLATATAMQSGANFTAYGGERLINALNTLRNQGNIYRQDLNPLGYDERYVPMQDFSALFGNTSTWKSSASESQNALANAKREFDSNVESMKTTILSLAENPGGYKTQLASLTGVSISDGRFLEKVTTAGDDLYDCSVDAVDFDTCVLTKTRGILGSKYSQIRNAELNVQRALKQKQNLLDQVEMENRKHNEMLEIENIYNTSYRDTLKNYLANMKNARTITETKTKIKGDKETTKETITSYEISNEQLNLNVKKEVAQQEALKDYRIAQMNVTDEITIKTYLNNIAETEIEIGLAIQAKNAAVADFDNGLKERDNLVFLYRKALEQVNYTVDTIKDKIPEVRVLRCQAALDLSKNLNNAVHYAYLAAKALEYKYMKPLKNVTVLNETLNIHDLYKVQTVEDLTTFLNKLTAYDSCSWGSVSRTTVALSLAKDILGFTDKYLNPNSALASADVAKLRYQKVQEYLSKHVSRSDNSLSYPFSTALNNNTISKFNKYNLKIWYGVASPPCDPVPTKGVAVKFVTSQTASITPYVNLTQKGHSTYLNKSREILSYIPVSEYLNLLSASIEDTLATTGRFNAYVNREPDTDSLWDPSFKGRSVAASNWEMQITDIGENAIDWSKVTDIVLYLDTMGSNLQ